MKYFKFKKSWYKDLTKLLTEVGAVSKDGKQSYPGHVYVNPIDYKEIKRGIRKEYVKIYSYLPSRKIDNAVSVYLLNYGPVECKAVQSEYVIVDDEKVSRETNDNNWVNPYFGKN